MAQLGSKPNLLLAVSAWESHFTPLNLSVPFGNVEMIVPTSWVTYNDQLATGI